MTSSQFILHANDTDKDIAFVHKHRYLHLFSKLHGLINDERP